MTKRRVPVLITWDVDPDVHVTYERKQQALSMAMDLCEAFDIRSTFFITAQFFAHDYSTALQRMKAQGHEVGCHGLTHTDEEEYHRMPEAMQQAYIEEATGKLETVTGMPIRSFRSPRVKISATTLRILAEHGYVVDSTVCSQRIDLVSSNLINPGWLLSPRRPYHPHHINPFKRGELPIWEVPISAMILPFISGTLNVFGLRFMRAFFRLLYAESKVTGKPIVYLAHPPEFISSGKRRRQFVRRKFTPSYIRTHGLLIRRTLYKMDGEAWFRATRDLFSYMASFPDLVFLTSSAYVNYLENHAEVELPEILP